MLLDILCHFYFRRPEERRKCLAKQEKGTLILLQKYQLCASWRVGMGQGWNGQVPVPLCALEGHGARCSEGPGVMPSPREHADLQEVFPLWQCACEATVYWFAVIYCFMLIESCFCNF